MALTDEQLSYIVGKRKSSPPSFFQASTGNDVSVTGDIEDSLIIAVPEAKSKALAYLRLILDANKPSSDYTDLLSEYTSQQAVNAKAKKDAIDDLLGKFSEFKDGLTRGSDENILRDGMTPLLTAISLGLGRIIITGRAVEFGNDFDSSAGEYFNTSLTDEQKQELRSWVRVLAAYR